MTGKSRIEEYRKLREEIENIDVYSFDDPKRMPPKHPEKEELLPIHNPEEEPFNQEDHIKKNTLSLSIDELIKQHEEYTAALQKDDIVKKIKDQKGRKKDRPELSFDLRHLLWAVSGVIIAVIVLIIALVIGGVI